MPSMPHEAPLYLFHNRPTLAPEILSNVLGVTLPNYTEVRFDETDFTQIVPTEYRADLVVLLLEDKPVFSIIVETQLSIDEDKSYTWPLYTIVQRAKTRAPAALLVVTFDEAVANWASKPIDIGQPCSNFVPVVLGPRAIPYITNIEQAKFAPEMAVLSALAHGNEPQGVEVALAVIGVTAGLDEERAKLYYDLVLSALNEASRKLLEEMMEKKRYEYQSEFAKKYLAQGVAQGVAQGEAKALLKILYNRGFTVSAQLQATIMGCSDEARLNQWIDRAFHAKSLEEVLDC